MFGWLAGRPALASLLLVALAVLVNAAYLPSGFSCDDFLIIEVLRTEPLPFSRWRGVWSFDGIDGFRHLWWADPDFAGAFWRPLASLVFEGSLAVFGQRAWPLHLLSLLLHGGVAAGLYLQVRSLADDGARLGLLAGLLFLLCEDHSMGVGWISTFTDMLSLGLVMAAWLAHRAWLVRRRWWALAASLAGFLLAMMCKESAVLAPILAVMMSALLPGGRERPQRAGRAVLDVWRRPLDWAPQVALTAGFLVLYKALNLGGMHNLMYIDPVSRPAAYLAHMVLHMPVMWLAALSPVPPSTSIFFPETLPWLAAGGLAVGVGWLWFSWPLLRRPVHQWALLVFLLGLLPQLGTDASERGLYQPYVGMAVLLAGLLLELRGKVRRLRAGAWVALLAVVLPGALLAVVYPWSFVPSLRAPEVHTRTAIPFIEASGADRVLLLTTPGMMETLYPGGLLDHLLEPDVDVWLLSSHNAVFTIERVDGTSFVLGADRPGWLTNMFARLVRTRPDIRPGLVRTQPPFTASIERTTADGSDALAVRFELRPPTDGLLLLYWTDRGYQRLDLSSLPLGEARQVTDVSDVWASMM